MWRLIEKLLQIIFLVTTAATVFVIAAIVWSSLRPPGPGSTGRSVDPATALVEVRLTSHGDASRLFVGQPLVFEVVLLNFEARRVRKENRVDPEGAATVAEIVLDYEDSAGDLPWERRLGVYMSTPGGTRILDTLDWHTKLLNPGVTPADRKLALAPARTTFIIDGTDLANLPLGRYILRVALPPEISPAEDLIVIPLEFELAPEPDQDTDRAIVSLAVARVAALRGEPARAVEAALTALELDPLQDEALTIVAEGWEQQGDLEKAVEWYERYLETLPDSENEQRNALEEYIDAVREQLD